MKWQLCNDGKSVMRTNADGSVDSRTLDDTEIKEWLAAGNTPDPDPEMALDKIRARRLAAINGAVNSYIHQHYDAGTQATLNATATSYTLALIDPATPAPVAAVIKTRIARIQAVLAWINDVLTYYYTVKTQIQGAADIAALDAVTWDFSAHDVADPLVTIPEVK